MGGKLSCGLHRTLELTISGPSSFSSFSIFQHLSYVRAMAPTSTMAAARGVRSKSLKASEAEFLEVGEEGETSEGWWGVRAGGVDGLLVAVVWLTGGVTVV
jgi:hypothetical protein